MSRGAEERGTEVEERRVTRRRQGAPDMQAGEPATVAQSGAGGPGNRSELSPLSPWVSSVEITHNMKYSCVGGEGSFLLITHSLPCFFHTLCLVFSAPWGELKCESSFAKKQKQELERLSAERC